MTGHERRERGSGIRSVQEEISFGLRWRVAAAQGFLCALCGETLGEEIDPGGATT